MIGKCKEFYFDCCARFSSNKMSSADEPICLSSDATRLMAADDSSFSFVMFAPQRFFSRSDCCFSIVYVAKRLTCVSSRNFFIRKKKTNVQDHSCVFRSKFLSFPISHPYSRQKNKQAAKWEISLRTCSKISSARKKCVSSWWVLTLQVSDRLSSINPSASATL